MKARQTGESYRPTVRVLKTKDNVPSRISINGIVYTLDVQSTGHNQFKEIREKVRGKQA